MWNTVLNGWKNLERDPSDFEYEIIDSACDLEFVNKCCPMQYELESDAWTHPEIQYDLNLSKYKMHELIDEELNVIQKTQIKSDIQIYYGGVIIAFLVIPIW